jgi:uncharacterized FlaG/YvyC family protein
LPESGVLMIDLTTHQADDSPTTSQMLEIAKKYVSPENRAQFPKKTGSLDPSILGNPDLEQYLKSKDIGLRFQVSEETKQVVVCVIDRANQKIIGLISQDQLMNLQAGDLLDLLGF